MTLVTGLEELIKSWKERRTLMGSEARTAFDNKDFKLQQHFMHMRKQWANAIEELEQVLNES